MASDYTDSSSSSEFFIHTLEELAELAARVVEKLRASASERADVITLSGELGAGKTAFVQAIGLTLGVSDPITSPTFTIRQRYDTPDERFPTLVHLDAYRFESAAELRPLNFEDDLADPRALVLIEWPERIPGALPDDAVAVSLEITELPTRRVTVRGLDLAP